MKFRATIRKEGQSDEVRTVEADSRFDVYNLVRNEGGFVALIEEEKTFSLRGLSRFNISIGTGVKRIEIIQTAKNLSAMLSAGLSISRALSVIERQSSNKNLKAIATGLSEAVRKGASFHESLAAYPKVFPEIFIAMARAGEESGSLSDSLTVVALQMERSEELKRKIKGAMIYPAIVVTAVIIVGILMLVYVVPTLTSTFTSLGVQVPLATRIIVSMSDFMVAHVSLVFMGLIAFVIGGIVFVRSRLGSRIVLSGALHFPVVNELVRETYAARASRTLSSLLSAGVPVLEALAITKEVVHAEVFASVVAEAEEHVRKGELLSTSFSEHSKLYPILMSDMLAVGEETGKVAEMLKQIAEFYEEDVAQKTKDLSTIIEPVLMLIIGSVVGVFAVSMIAPIYQLSSAIG
jgi:type IV pilus assembly protein PilC